MPAQERGIGPRQPPAVGYESISSTEFFQRSFDVPKNTINPDESTPLTGAAKTTPDEEPQPFVSDLGKTYPQENSTAWGNLFFSWLTPLLELGSKRPIEAEDLYQLNPSDRAEEVSKVFEQYWTREVKDHPNNPSLARTFFYAFGGPFLLAGLLKLIHDSLLFVAPMVINGVIDFLADPSADKLKMGVFYTVLVLCSGIIQSFCLRQYFYVCFNTGMKMRSAVVTAVYRKSLILSNAARQRHSAGEITNLMSVDAQNLQELTPYLHGLWYGFYQIGLSMYFLWGQMGPSCLAGVAVIVLAIPASALIARYMQKLQRKLMEVKDERIKICYEVLNGMKVIKLQTWEKSFAKKVMDYRDDELKQLRRYLFTRTASGTLYNTLPSLVAVGVFVTYVLVGHELKVSVALTSLSLFQILRFPLFMIPQVINNVVEASVSFQRLTQFLLEEERIPISPGPLTDIGVLIEKADFSWEGTSSKDTEQTTSAVIRDASLTLNNGQLCAVIGHVGSGKSSLLGGILGDARCIAGNVYRRGTVAYVSQRPFIQNASLRDNILFGAPFHAKRYKRAIIVSALEPDLKILPAGDLTEIGEKGINLSGGQRARVGIARAVYQNADVYLFDDPLAAVDGHVGRHIFNKCIQGELSGKLRVLVTHSVSFLSQCDWIVAMKEGSMVQSGAYYELMKEKGGVLSSLVISNRKGSQMVERTSSSSLLDLEAVEEKKELERDLQKSASFKSARNKDKQKLMTIEDRSIGDVPFSVYQTWINAAGGPCLFSCVFLVYIGAQFLNVASSFWLSIWSVQATTQTEFIYLGIYVAIQLSYSINVYGRLIFMYICSLRASRHLFEWVLQRIMHAPMTFFDTTPLGRIVNRLSKDISTIDQNMPQTWDSYTGCIVSVGYTLLTICYVTPAFAPLLIPIIIGYYMSQRYFIHTSRELQRLDNISRSPVYALLGETLDGLETIHAFSVEELFVHQNETLLDTNQRAYFLNFSTNCWLALRLEFAGTCIATGATLFAVLQHGSENALFAGLAGVSLSYAFNVTQMLNWSVRMISQLQTQMVSVERIKTYAEMPVEDDDTEKFPPPEKWPQDGAIDFFDVALRYRHGLPLVLKDLTFIIKPREKIGVVGRTGAGKSSLMVALMRIVDISSGMITIDNIDTSTLSLEDLRSCISIIPQDPQVFSGSVRSNLDPFHKFSDDEVWKSLKRAHLTSKIPSLDFVVSENGSNLSVGERQLLCIARALLKKSRIILLDEATASIDIETDAIIQDSIKTEFADCTCLTIAHRINTVMDSDRVLVMEKGSVVEFDTVDNLMRLPNGIFASLVDEWKDSTFE